MRPERTGFHARVHPRPPVPVARWTVGAAAFAVAGLGLGVAVGDGGWLTLQVFLGILFFGALLAVFGHLPGFAPVELEVDDERVYWNGDRFEMARVTGARARGGTLELVGNDGVLAHLEHLRPEVAAWLAAAITASVPDRTGPFTSGSG